MPRFLLNALANNMLDTKFDVPEETYHSSSSELAKNYSRNLTPEEKMRFILKDGTNITECDIDSGFISEMEALKLAKNAIYKEYKAKRYPYSVESEYNNWYSWESHLFKYTDSVYNAYTVYKWEITFTKHDGSLAHKICMTDDGEIISLETITP